MVVPALEQALSTSGARIPSRGVSVGTIVSDGTDHTTGSHAYETVSARRHPSGSHGKRRRSVGSSERSISTRTAIVDTWSTLGNRHSIPSRTPPPPEEMVFTDASSKGCWCSVQRDHVEWDVAEIGSPHQLAGAQSGVSCNSTSPVQVEGKDDDLHDRQRNNRVLPKEAGGGGGEITSVTQTVDENTETGTPAADQHSTETHCGSTECTSRPCVAHGSGNAIGMVAIG